MNIMGTFIRGFFTVITVTAAPQLYRYPYRSSCEGLKGDMQRVGGDIESILGKLDERRSDRHGGRYEYF